MGYFCAIPTVNPRIRLLFYCLLFFAGLKPVFSQYAPPIYYGEELLEPTTRSNAKPSLIPYYEMLVAEWRISGQVYVDEYFAEQKDEDGKPVMAPQSLIQLTRFLDQYPNWIVLFTCMKSFYPIEDFVPGSLLTNTSIGQIKRAGKSGYAILVVNYDPLKNPMNKHWNAYYNAGAYYADLNVGREQFTQLKPPLVKDLPKSQFRAITNFILDVEQRALEEQKQIAYKAKLNATHVQREIKVADAAIGRMEQKFQHLKDSLGTPGGEVLNPDFKFLYKEIADAKKKKQQSDFAAALSITEDIAYRLSQYQTKIDAYQLNEKKLQQASKRITHFDTLPTKPFLQPAHASLLQLYEKAELSWKAGNENYGYHLQLVNEQLDSLKAQHDEMITTIAKAYTVKASLSAITESDLQYDAADQYEEAWLFADSAIVYFDKGNEQFVPLANKADSTLQALNQNLKEKQWAIYNSKVGQIFILLLLGLIGAALGYRLMAIIPTNRKFETMLKSFSHSLEVQQIRLRELAASFEQDWENFQSGFEGKSGKVALTAYKQTYEAKAELENASKILQDSKNRFRRGGRHGHILLKLFSNSNRSGLSKFEKQWPKKLEAAASHLAEVEQLYPTLVAAAKEAPELMAANERRHRKLTEEIRYQATAVFFNQEEELTISFDQTYAALDALGLEIAALLQTEKSDPLGIIDRARSISEQIAAVAKNYSHFAHFRTELLPAILEKIPAGDQRSRVISELKALLRSFDKSLAMVLNGKLAPSKDLLAPLHTIQQRISKR